MKEPRVCDWIKLRRLISYAYATKETELVLRPKGIFVEAYADASFATHHDKKSHLGVIVTIGGALIYASSKRAKINALSAAEAEMQALSATSQYVIWAQHFLEEQGYKQLPAAHIHEDSKATLDNLEREAPTGANSRHYLTKYFHICDYQRRGVITVAYLNTIEQTSDILTKGLPRATFQRLAQKLLNSGTDASRDDP